jgi:hypothetical protein
MSPMSPASGLQPPRNCHKMGMIPGSSTVEHSAVNGGLQIQELVSLASVSSLGTIPKHPFLVPLMSPVSSKSGSRKRVFLLEKPEPHRS